jgi:hypothetical protein
MRDERERREKRDGWKQCLRVLLIALAAHVTHVPPISLVDHSNRRTPEIQCGFVGSIDGRVAIAQHRTVFV